MLKGLSWFMTVSSVIQPLFHVYSGRTDMHPPFTSSNWRSIVESNSTRSFPWTSKSVLLRMASPVCQSHST